MRSAATIFTILLAASSFPAADAGEASPREQVLAELERYYEDLSARDWKAFSDHFWPGATLTTVWQPPGEPRPAVIATTVPDFVARAPEGPDSKPVFEEKMTGAEIKVAGGLAQAWATYSARFGNPGELMTWAGIDAFTLIFHEGRWRIVSIAYAQTSGHQGPGRKED